LIKCFFLLFDTIKKSTRQSAVILNQTLAENWVSSWKSDWENERKTRAKVALAWWTLEVGLREDFPAVGKHQQYEIIFSTRETNIHVSDIKEKEQRKNRTKEISQLND
jgi:hypothetical protein